MIYGLSIAALSPFEYNLNLSIGLNVVANFIYVIYRHTI